ncbi:MAG: tetratricopeptide repeat protein [Acidobacteria bacterium]|nr:tetratricopeptide repeat protein [Acidobacteriota bacterium]
MNLDSWKLIETVFQQALQLPPEKWVEFLDRACLNKPELRREVESLLASWQRSHSFLENPAIREGVALLEQQSGSAWVGRQIGPYRIVRELGHGGMGAVYLGERSDEAFHKQVAIKLLRPTASDDHLIERFHTERQILASLEHPNIARLLDGGSTSEGMPFLVMEYMEGIPVDQYCRQHSLSLTQQLKLFLHICEAVQFAHKNLIVHRDLKPSNILVNSEGVPKLLDFGIAKLLASPDSSPIESQNTLSGILLLTPDYSSPEQARGERVNTATDIYSLGVLLYRLLSGHPPYRLESNNPAEIIRIISEVEPEKPSLAVLKPIPEKTGERKAGGRLARQDSFSGRPDLSRPHRDILPLRHGWAKCIGVFKVPRGLRASAERSDGKHRRSRRLRGDLDNIVIKAMHKEPGRRYVSVEQFAADIRRHLDGLPVLARPATLGYRTAKFLRRNKAAVLAVALIFLSLAGGILAAWRGAMIARVERDRARQEARKSEGVTQFLQNMLGSADPHTAGPQVTVGVLLDQASRRVKEELRSDPATESAVRTTIGMAYLGLGIYDSAEQQIRQALRLRGQLYGPESIEVAQNYHQLALIAMERGDPVAADPLCRHALRLVEARKGSDDVEAASMLNTLATLCLHQGDFDQAERTHRRALALRRKMEGNQSVNVAESLNNLAIVLGTKGDYREAESLHEEALSILIPMRGAANFEVSVTMSNLASIKEALKKFTEAESLFQQVIAVRIELLGRGHPEVAFTSYNYAYMLYKKGDYPKACRISREILDLRGKSLPETHPMVAAALHVLGCSLMAEGQPDTAMPYLAESLELRRKGLPKGHWLVANSASVWAQCLGRLGRRTEAEPVLLSTYQQLEASLGPKHERTQEALQRIVDFFTAGNQIQKAAEYRKKFPL